MSSEMTYRLMLALVVGFLLTGILYWKRTDPVSFFSKKEKPRYTPYFAYWLLPGFLLLVFCLLPLMLPRGGGNSLLGLLFQAFLHLALYNSLLLLFHPLLRRFLQPQTCVVLWLLPNWLYLCISTGNYRLDRPLLVSPAVATPLSIGLFPSTLRVVLPQRDYTQKELDLILRHELIHIGRGDSTAKFFLTFCTALCWFNPLMWTAMRQGAEDLELSCDQEVLAKSDEEERQEYARLLLRTAGEQAGFTTCLSASASSLRRRLQRALHPTRRFICGIAAGLAAFALVMTFGWAALAYDVTGQEVFFPGGTREDWSFSNIYLSEMGACQASDPEALADYLSGLELGCLAGQYSFQPQGRKLSMYLYGPEGSRFLSLRDNVAQSFPLATSSYESNNSYLITNGVDWEYLESLLTPEKDAA